MRTDDLLQPVADFYSGRLERHGSTPGGVDWPSARVQEIRFHELMRLLPPAGAEPVSILDYGCGYGALADYLRGQGHWINYTGFDVSAAMVAAASATVAGARFTGNAADLEDGQFDYVLSSGIFNVKLDADVERWKSMMLETIARFDALSRRGFGFNVLSARREADRKMPHLFYADPAELLRLCLERYSPEVALLHDYGLWDFTVLVRK